MKAVRLDPGMLFPMYASGPAAITGVLADLARWNADSVFVFAYSPIFGAYYKSTVADTWPSFLSGEDWLRKFVAAAVAKGIKVVASYRLNHYEGAPATPTNPAVPFHLEWRMLTQRTVNGVHEPYVYGGYGTPIHPISAYGRTGNVSFADWFGKLMTEAAAIPGLHGLEACEGNVDESASPGLDMPDFNAEALKSFAVKFPGKAIGGSEWLRHRADGLTELHKRLRDAAKAKGLKSYVIHDLPITQASFQSQALKLKGPNPPTFSQAEAGLSLVPLADYAAACGFDWSAIRALGFDGHIVSAIWQQRQQDAGSLGHPVALMSPKWAAHAAAKLKTMLPAANVLTHVEVTRWPAAAPDRAPSTPTPSELYATIRHALAASGGVTIYSYDQLKMVDQTAKLVDSGYAYAVRDAFA